MTLLEGNLLLFGGLFENTYRDGFYTLGDDTLEGIIRMCSF